ncbi:MFS transporter [Marivivens aquimaris]|uniref:MFS transporter n=1 Tax=Marivivens aquimaris TaxID=2774876 RepID=UPI00187E262F|nr:MFS transporter [Marivivens aquimaris]
MPDQAAPATQAKGAVFSMSLCVALLIASEFMPASLLTPMAEGLNATEGQTGQAISISGIFAVLASLTVTTVAGEVNRKWVLISMTALMLVSLVLIAAAPNFAWLIVARALLGISIGGFWALATSVIMRLVVPDAVPRALSVMYTGQAISAALAAPIGSWLGSVIGWRGVFWVLVPLVLFDLVWQLLVLPSLPARGRQTFGNLFALLRRPYFAKGLVALTLIYGSAFSMFTYLRPFLEQVTGANIAQLSSLFLVMGLAGFAGTWAAGRLVPRYGTALMVSPPLIMGAVTAGLLIFGANVWIVAALLAVWGAMNTAVSIIWFGWMSRNVDDAAEAAGSLMVAVIQASILLGALIGGILLDWYGITATFLSSILLAGIAVGLVRSGKHLMRR